MALRISKSLLRQMWTEGVPTVQIAARMGCDPASIRNHARRLGLPKRPHGGRRVKGERT
jgi:uncharacterized protein YjcR